MISFTPARARPPGSRSAPAARRSSPFVTTYHGAYGGRSSLKLRYNSVMARGDVVIANSQFTADTIERLYPFARGRLCVIPRGMDLGRFSAAAVDRGRVLRLREAWGVAPHERIVLLAARLTEWKGQRVLIEAARLLKERGFADVRYVLAGDAQGRDGYARDLDARIRRAGLERIVLRVGHCADIPAALIAASVLAAPSTAPEAFGRSAVEAQAMGAMVVVSDSRRRLRDGARPA